MTQPPPVPAPPSRSSRSPTAPLFLWLVIQFIALSLAALRVPLAARGVVPAEQPALHILLVTQVIAAAVLFPVLLRGATSSAMAILSIAPFVQLAGYLSSVSPMRCALASLHVALWLATLALWRAALRTRRAEMLAVACAVAASLGGAILWYVRAEAREPLARNWSIDGLFGPALGAVAQVVADSPPAGPWVVALALLLLGAALCVTSRRRVEGNGTTGNAV